MEFTRHHKQNQNTYVVTKNDNALAMKPQMQKVAFIFVPWPNYTLPIIALLMLCTFLLFNALFIRRDLYNKETLCKHNQWKMGDEHVVKLGFHTGQYKETSLVFHIANYLRNS